ncbi:M48 family metalloprotease [Fuerstiella marisgermanici]|uniref:Peptidase M48 domain-containing protein n=1 Tax=Fuerstiella marisgermanici TaxID=1891926 RepID=A0A1P8WDZ3_9PLAN|nr:M48 family metalloprotease [Fuerstiella marisgermanici]APZ92305.1 hypothetical protein Fuma_01915 [Fuerstiella marisgermanici]
MLVSSSTSLHRIRVVMYDPPVMADQQNTPLRTGQNEAALRPPVAAREFLTAYHRELRHYLQHHRLKLYNWFGETRRRADAYEASKLNLLKTAYRLDRDSAAVLYLQCDAIAARMGLSVPVTLYQAQQSSGLNAGMTWLPGEAHIVLHGPLQETLTEREMEALLAHELAHYELLSIDDGEFHIVDEVLSAMTNDANSGDAESRTWRNYKLYTELYCDRRAAMITEDIDACICCLLKIETGQSAVNADAYLQQAEEILEKERAGSDGVTHPEMYIRAKSLKFWADDPATCDEKVKPLIEGPLQLATLDLLQQQSLARITKSFLQDFLKPEWLQTPVLIGHAKRFFEDFTVPDAAEESVHSDVADFAKNPDAPPTPSTPPSHGNSGESHYDAQSNNNGEELKSYFCYLLLDFATCDPDLEEAALAAAVVFADKLKLRKPFDKLCADELKIGKRTLHRVQKEAKEIVLAAETEFVA